ncbi:MAG: sensor histidine kinase [Treponema sp.]|nr:sensor histidine kinase [Treponema sp.]
MIFPKSEQKFIGIFTLIFFVLLSTIFLSSCKRKDNQIDELLIKWMLVEDKIEESNGIESEQVKIQFDEFLSYYKEFQKSQIFKHLYISEYSGAAIQALDKQIQTKDIQKIRTAIYQFELHDKKITQQSNAEYLFLAQALLLFSIIISILLFLIFKGYERKRNEAKQLGIYSTFMIKGIESERKRISKDIHDTVLQDLKALSLKTELIDSTDKNENEEIKKDLISQTDLCIKQLRIICNNLTPVEFKNQRKDMTGFILALNNLVAQFIEKTKTSCILKIQDNLDLGSLSLEQSINVFRIIQEALSNVEKHAKASQTSLVITNSTDISEKKYLKVYITDNGKGFNQEKIEKVRYGHFGLSNMKERAKALGGTLEIRSDEDEGTEIKLEVPLK